MGYFSDVVIAIPKDLATDMIGHFQETGNESAIDLLKCARTFLTPNEVAIFQWDCVKWYYDDATSIDHFIRQQTRYPFRILIVGEDAGDVTDSLNESYDEEYENLVGTIFECCYAATEIYTTIGSNDEIDISKLSRNVDVASIDIFKGG